MKPSTLLRSSLSSLVLSSCLLASQPVKAQVKGETMVGEWSGTMAGYYGAKASKDEPVRFVIQKSNGRSFEGYSEYTNARNAITKIVFNGFVFPDGDGLATNKNGYFDLRLMPTDELHVIFRDADPETVPGPITLYGVFTRK